MPASARPPRAPAPPRATSPPITAGINGARNGMSTSSFHGLAIHGIGQPLHPNQFCHSGYPTVRGKHVVLPAAETGHVVFEEPHHARVVDVPRVHRMNNQWFHMECGLEKERACDKIGRASCRERG